MAQKRRVMAILLASLITAAVILSCAFIIGHADHDCTGESCLVCETLAACARMLHRLPAVPAPAAGVCFFALLAACVVWLSTDAHAHDTPVSLRVKLSD